MAAEPLAFDTLEGVDGEIRRRQGTSLSISAAVDGSQMSDRAMAAALALFNNRRGDKFTILHVSDSSKDWLPKHLQPFHLKHYYTDMALGARVAAEWLCREKEEGRSTCECLTRMADKKGVDLLVVGSWGRKGEKLDMLGSVSDFSLRQSHCSICIVRSTGTSLGGLTPTSGGGVSGGGSPGSLTVRPARYLFATDGSHASHLAFCYLAAYLLRPLDNVHVVMVTGADGTEEAKVVEQYRLFMQARKISGAVHVKCIDRLRSTIPEGIVDAVSEYGCDVLVVGISGYGRKKLGSVSSDVSTRASCTTIIIKDNREIIANRYSTAGNYTLAGEVQSGQ